MSDYREPSGISHGEHLERARVERLGRLHTSGWRNAITQGPYQGLGPWITLVENDAIEGFDHLPTLSGFATDNVLYPEPPQ
jgi:hypothetical protein